ncbi:tail terminator [Burkholderia phage FLC5]|uniref:Tail completion protein (R) n=1 Tax=Burkholderia phage FLC5 TaxID=2716322 RepID=A0A7G1GM28_9CAUD|nr:tail terminator [Burkholderia phage FLC5]BCB23202.1 tail completion protein (R) [Burkholderia phage FLC5]
MNKANSLRKALNAAVPSLSTDPDKLLVFIDAGNIIATGAASGSFDYAYTLNVMLLDFAGDADIVFAALIAWVKRNQSDLLTNDDLRKTGISFEADALTQTTVDLSIKLKLSESVVVGTDDAGAQTITHVDEPVPEWEVTGLYDPASQWTI